APPLLPPHRPRARRPQCRDLPAGRCGSRRPAAPCPATEGVMMRRFYILLLRLHPRPFLQEFGGEMLWIYDEAPDYRRVLFGDVVMPLLRQWMFRPPVVRARQTANAGGRGPVFYSLGSETPCASALIQGGLASVLVFWWLSLLIANGSGPEPLF